MKNLAIIIALLLFSSLAVNATENNVQYVNNQQQGQTQQVDNKQNQTKNDYSDQYLLKYNIDDLEAAPWLHGGKRVY